VKKIIMLNVAAIFMASAAFAGTAADLTSGTGKNVAGTGGPATGATIGKLSTKVGLGWETAAGGYAIYTQHEQGTKAYGSAHNSTSIFMKDVTKGTAETAPSTTGSDNFDSSWKTM